jgi:hypothetical protein
MDYQTRRYYKYSSVGVAMDNGLDCRGSNPLRGKRIFRVSVYWLRGAGRLLAIGYRVLFAVG